jgi:uncharacterized protein (TIGR02246 family)
MIRVSLALVVVLSASLSAQSPDDIVRAEHARVKAIHAGAEDALYTEDYVGIPGNGSIQDVVQVRAAGANPNYAISDVKAQVYGNAAIATGTQLVKTGGNARFVRVWVRQGDTWKVASFHSTRIGEWPDAPPVVAAPTAEPTSNFKPSNDDERAVMQVLHGIIAAGANADAAAYARLTSKDFVRIGAQGQLFTREQWLADVAKRSKGPGVIAYEIKIRVYGDLAVLTDLNTGKTADGAFRPPARVTSIFVKEDGQWKLRLTQSTPVRQAGNTSQ